MGTSDRQFTVKALDASTWPAFADLVERNNGVWGGCWCAHFHPDCAEKGTSPQANRAYKERLVRAGQAHAALVFDGDVAVGWCEYGPPDELPTIYHRKEYEAGVVTPADWRIPCLFVGKGHRRKGVARTALAGALELIAAAGGGRVEAYPQDLRAKKVSGAFLYNGTREFFENAGFTYDRPKGKNHCVMVLEVPPKVRQTSRMAEKVQGPKSYFPSIENKYGKPISFWMDALDELGPAKHMEQVAYLKDTYGMGHGHANAIVAVYRSEHPTPE